MRTYTDLDSYLSLSPSDWTPTQCLCPACGREHTLPFQAVRSGVAQLEHLPEIIQAVLGEVDPQVGVIFDRQIQSLVEERILSVWQDWMPLPLGAPGQLLDASVEIGDATATTLPEHINILVGVGSGVICDLTKWVATKRGLPFMIVGTAASVNAYTSITGSMTENNVKVSKWLNPANAVVLDGGLMATAPQLMTGAGVGDLLARSISNADWRLSQLLRGTYFCPVPFRMMSRYQEAFLGAIAAVGKSDPEALSLVGDAILVSGYSMTILNGETSPSSGSEHILSHFFDFQHNIFDLPKQLHGAQVGVGTIIMSAAYEFLREVDPASLDVDSIERRRLSEVAIELDHRRVFGEHADVLNAATMAKRIDDQAFPSYLKQILRTWDDLWETVEPFLMPSQAIRRTLVQAGGVTTLKAIQRTQAEAEQALLYGSHYRKRYTVLDLFWELGLFPEVAPRILERAGVLD